MALEKKVLTVVASGALPADSWFFSVFRIPSTFISTLLWNSFGMGEESRVTCWKCNPWGVYSLTQEAPGIQNKISSLQVQLVVHIIHGYPSCYNGQFHFALF